MQVRKTTRAETFVEVVEVEIVEVFDDDGLLVWSGTAEEGNAPDRHASGSWLPARYLRTRQEARELREWAAWSLVAPHAVRVPGVFSFIRHREAIPYFDGPALAHVAGPEEVTVKVTRSNADLVDLLHDAIPWVLLEDEGERILVGDVWVVGMTADGIRGGFNYTLRVAGAYFVARAPRGCAPEVACRRRMTTSGRVDHGKGA